jgi:hypothetical protein
MNKTQTQLTTPTKLDAQVTDQMMQIDNEINNLTNLIEELSSRLAPVLSTLDGGIILDSNKVDEQLCSLASDLRSFKRKILCENNMIRDLIANLQI